MYTDIICIYQNLYFTQIVSCFFKLSFTRFIKTTSDHQEVGLYKNRRRYRCPFIKLELMSDHDVNEQGDRLTLGNTVYFWTISGLGSVEDKR